LAAGLRQNPLGELRRSLRPTSRNGGLLLRGREGGEDGKGRGKGGKGEKEERGKRGFGRGRGLP